MSAQDSTVTVPAVEDVVSELVATLALVAHAYLEPTEEGKEPDLASAGIAIDTAGDAFERIAPRLKTEQHAALSGLLTDIRMTYVRKRGL
jgi:hypothetical protein